MLVSIFRINQKISRIENKFEIVTTNKIILMKTHLKRKHLGILSND